jgi:phospholipid/cholesterol/gamma-HCH transport system substrate-binding protein
MRSTARSSIRGPLLKLMVFTAFSVTVAVVLYSTLANSLNERTSSYVAMFANASGLHPGDNVRVAGVRVGRVDKVSLAGTQAEVRFSVKDTQPILKSTTIAIRYQNLIGQRYVSLVPGPGAADVLPPGSVIPKASTQDALDLTVLLNGFQPLFRVLSPADINRLSASVVGALQGERGSVTTLLQEASELSSHLADRDEVIGRVITNFSRVLEDIGSRDTQVDNLIAQLRALAVAAAADRDQIGTSIAALADLTDSTTALLRDVRPQLRTDIAKLGRVARTYAEQQQPFASAVRGLPAALEAFARIMQYGSWVNLYVCNLEVSRPGEKSTGIGDTGANSRVCQ